MRSALGLAASLLVACGAASPRSEPAAHEPAPSSTPQVASSTAEAPAPVDDAEGPCLDTASCQERARREEEALARAVAAEPASALLPVARIAADVLVAEEAGVVLVLRDQALVALDRQTGRELWRSRGVSHQAVGARQLERLGDALVVREGASITRIALGADLRRRPPAPETCALALPVAMAAEHAFQLDLFVRAGQPYARWIVYPAPPPSGTPMAPRPTDARYECGVARVDLASCTLTPEDPRAFVLASRGPPTTTGLACISQVVPALVATRAPPSTTALHVDQGPASQCGVTVARTLVSDAPAWTAALDPQPFPCPVP